MNCAHRWYVMALVPVVLWLSGCGEPNYTPGAAGTPRRVVNSRIDSLTEIMHQPSPSDKDRLALAALYLDAMDLELDRSFNIQYYHDTDSAGVLATEAVQCLEKIVLDRLDESAMKKYTFLHAKAFFYQTRLAEIARGYSSFLDYLPTKPIRMARMYIRNAISADPANAELYSLMGQSFQRFLIDGNNDSAAYYLNHAIQLDREYAGAYLASNGGDLIDAAIWRAMHAKKRNSRNYTSLANIFLNNEKYDMGRRESSKDRFVKVPSFAKSFLYVGIQYFQKTSGERVVAFCNKALAINPENWNAAFLLSRYYDGLKDYDRASRYYLLCRDINRAQTDALPFYGEAFFSSAFTSYLAQRNPDDPGLKFRTILESGSDSLRVFPTVGLSPAVTEAIAIKCASMLGKDVAAKFLPNAVARFPQSGKLRYMLGAVFADQGKFNEAVGCYLQALNLGASPFDIIDRYRIDVLNGHPQAPGLVREIESKYIGNDTVFLHLGEMYYWIRDWQKSLAYFKTAARLNPSYPGYLLSQGWIYSVSGDFERAVAVLLKADSLAAKNYDEVNPPSGQLLANAYYLLAEQRQVSGDTAGYERYRSLALDVLKRDKREVPQDLRRYEMSLTDRDTVSIRNLANNGSASAKEFLRSRGIDW